MVVVFRCSGAHCPVGSWVNFQLPRVYLSCFCPLLESIKVAADVCCRELWKDVMILLDFEGDGCNV